MRNVLVALLFVALASGFLAYREGYLADFHPLLDPGGEAGAGAEASGGEEESETDEDGAAGGKRSASAATASREEESEVDQNRAEEARRKAERKKAIEQKAEEERLAREELLAEREAKKGAAKAAMEERRVHNEKTSAELLALQQRWDEVNKQVRTSESNMRNKEREWGSEKIKTSEAERNELRGASAAYIKQLRDQLAEIEAQIRQKRQEFR